LIYFDGCILALQGNLFFQDYGWLQGYYNQLYQAEKQAVVTCLKGVVHNGLMGFLPRPKKPSILLLSGCGVCFFPGVESFYYLV
jgi:hypothetical protein